MKAAEDNGKIRTAKKEKTENFLHYLKIVTAVIGLVGLVVACWFGYHFGQAIFTDESMTNNRATNITYELTVTKGESVYTIGRELEKNGIIESGLAFLAQTKIYDCKIDPGTYTVSSRQSSKDIVKYLNQEYVKAHQESE